MDEQTPTTHVYIGIESLTLTAPQRAALVERLKLLGPGHADRPCLLNHWRVRPDGLAAIFEAGFDVESIGIAGVKSYLANIFNIAAGDISHTLQTVSFADGTQTVVVTLKYANQNRLRLALFGGVDATWETSHAEVLGYLRQYAAAWEPVE
jgi:hypothetical protein